MRLYLSYFCLAFVATLGWYVATVFIMQLEHWVDKALSWLRTDHPINF